MSSHSQESEALDQEDRELSLEERLEEARKIQADFQQLLKSAGWVRLVETYIKPQIENRFRQARFSAWNSMDALFGNAALMNEGNGLQLVVTMAEGALEAMTEEIENILREMRYQETRNV